MSAPVFERLDFEAYHRDTLPPLLAAGRGAIAARGARRLRALAFRLPDGAAWTYRPTGNEVAIERGDSEATTIVELDRDAWEGLVHDYESAPGLLYAGRVRCRRGDPMDFVRWEPVLRALYTGRPVFEPERVRLVDRAGAPLDPARSFVPDADRDEMRHFLQQTGYLCVRGLFRPDEVAAFLAEARALRREAVKGDELSWWAKDASGAEICCRVTRGADGPRLATLRADPRLRALADLAEAPLENRIGEGSGIALIYKSPAMSEGLSDLPWHRDCGMGGHSILCPTLIASIYLTPATPETGELRFLPGSWRGSWGFRESTGADARLGVAFRLEPGDATIHYGDVMHAAPAPTRTDRGEYRTSVTTAFARPGARPHRGRQSYNEVLHQRSDGQVEHLAAVAKRAV